MRRGGGPSNRAQRALLLLSALLLVCEASAKPPQVTAVEKLDAESQHVLEHFDLVPFDFAATPAMRPVLSAIAANIQKMVVPEDGANDYRVLLVESGPPYASVSEINGKKYIFLGTGLLNFARSDDSLFYVIGHEMEHPISDLGKHQKQERASGNFFSPLVYDLLGKAEESEVDLKSTFRRVTQLNLSPYGARDFLLDFLRIYGNHASRTHPLPNSRLNVLDIGLTAAVRGLGKQYNVDSRETKIVNAAKQVLQNKTYQDQNQKRLREVLQEHPKQLETILTEIKSAGSNPNYTPKLSKYSSDKPISVEVDRRISRVTALAPHTATANEILALRMEAVRSVLIQYEALRKKILGADFSPSNSVQLEELYHLEKSNPLGRVLGVGQDSVLISAEAKIRILQTKIDQVASSNPSGEDSSSERDQHTLAALHANLEQAKRNREYLLSVFGDNKELARSIVEKAAIAYVPILQNYGTIPKEVFEANDLLQELLPGFKGFEKVRKQRLADLADKVARNLKIDASSPQMILVLREILEHASTENQRSLLASLRERLMGEVLKSPNEASQDNDGIDQRYSNYLSSLTALNSQMRPGPGISKEETASDLKQLVPQLVDRLQTFDSFRSVIPQVFYNHSPNSNRSIKHIELEDKFTHKTIRTASPDSSDDLISPFAVPKIAAALSRIALKETKGVATAADLLRVLDDYLHTIDQLRSSQSRRSSTAGLIRSQVDQARSLFTETMLRLAPGANAADVDAYFQLRYQRYASYKPPGQHAWLPTGELGRKVASLNYERLGLPKEIDFLSAVILATQAKMNVLNYLEQLPDFKISGPWGRDVFGLSNSEMEAYVHGLTTLEGTASAKSNEVESQLVRKSVRLESSSMPAWSDSYLYYRQPFFSRSLSIALRDNQSIQSLDTKTWAKRAARQWYSSIEPCFDNNYVMTALRNQMDNMRFAEAAEFALALNEQLIEGAKQRAVAAAKMGQTALRNSLDEYASRVERFGGGSVFDFPNLVDRFQILKDPGSVDAAYLAKLYSLASRTNEPSHEMNGVFEYLWSKKDINPAVARELLNPEIISVLSYDSQKRDVALFQLRHKLGWDNYKKKSDSGELDPPKVHEVRDVIRQAKALIQEQFPEPGAIKNQVIDRIEKDFASSLEENRFIGSDRITSKNWHESPLVLAVDIPSSISSKLRSDYDRMDMVKHMIGVNPTIPAAVEEQLAEFGQASKKWEEGIRRDFGAFISLFRSSDPAARTYVLQNLLGEADSLFENPQMMKQIHDLVLGNHSTDRVYRKLFVAYLDSIPANEKKVLLAYVLSSFLDNPDKKSGASVKSVLEAMGPFGIKVGQYLRSSGLVSPSLHQELDDFYDRALEPSRYRSYQDLEKALGHDLPGLEGVRELVGSGSLNYGMLVEYLDKKGVKRRSVIRIQREEAGGQIQNEDKNWTEAIAKLYQDGDEDIRALAQVLEESRLTAMQTLGDQGKEMDLGYERAQYGNARTAYENEKVNSSTGLRIEVATPDLELQAKVLTEMGKKVSAYQYVPNTRFQDLDAEMKSKVATQIVEAELRALFQKGIFDPDGHPGNWLVDTESGRLVRIDYAQMTRIDPARLLRFREVISSLFLPGRVKEKAALIANNLPVLFEIKGNTRGMETMLANILRDPKLPPFSNPHLRLMYIRQELERALKKREPSASVRLSQEARAVLGSVSRMLSYKDHISTETFERLLKEHVGLQFSKLDYLRLLGTRDGRELVAQKILSTVGGRSSDIATKCLNYLKLFRRKR